MSCDLLSSILVPPLPLYRSQPKRQPDGDLVDKEYMPVTCDEYNGVSVVTVKGDLGSTEATALREVLADRAKRPNVVIDLEACHFMASVGLEALLDALRLCEQRAGRLMLAGLDANCRKVLQITRLDHRFECHDDLTSALKGMT
jgi:anti-anti-sigma factor